MNVLVACEFSGIVRDAFLDMGHNAISCDLEPSERPGPHLQGDVEAALRFGWDLIIAFPPCTHICVSGNRWYAGTRERDLGVIFAKQFWEYADKVCIENPVSVLSSHWRRPTQIIQPWMFGHGETKATCLWLKGLEPLSPTRVVDGRQARVHRMAPSPVRSRERSRTYAGIAAAMAEQWG